MSETSKEQKQKQYKTPRNTEGGKYYYISNPTQKNLGTKNFCVSWKFLKNMDKDFIFEWTNPGTGKQEKKILNRYYVKRHTFPKFDWQDKLDENGNPVINKKTGRPVREKGDYICHMISYQWIDRYEELVARNWAAPVYVPRTSSK